MALKDWKKAKRKSIHSIDFINEKTSRKIEINNISGKPVFVNVLDENLSSKLEREFDTKQQALAWAKDYMKVN